VKISPLKANLTILLQVAVQRPESGPAFVPPRIFPESGDLELQGFLNGHTSRIPTSSQEHEDTSTSIELIQQTRKPEFSSPGVFKTVSWLFLGGWRVVMTSTKRSTKFFLFVVFGGRYGSTMENYPFCYLIFSFLKYLFLFEGNLFCKNLKY
jgi:hypothetical protein